MARIKEPPFADLFTSPGVGIALSWREWFRNIWDRAIPSGGIIMWSGLLSNMPDGWVLCDGTNSTPDLRDRFIVGAAAGANPGATGGATTHTHTAHSNHVVTQPANHSNHSFTQPANHVVTQPSDHASHTHTGASTAATPDLVAPDAAATGVAEVTGGPDAVLTHAGTAVDAHSGGAVDAHSVHSGTAVDAHSAHNSPDHRPPYYALAFIMKI